MVEYRSEEDDVQDNFDTYSFVTASDKMPAGAASTSPRTFETFYEGELKWKSGKVSKTKIFATILKGDPSFYIIDRKLLPKVDGKIPDRVNPYNSNFEIKNVENQDQ